MKQKFKNNSWGVAMIVWMIPVVLVGFKRGTYAITNALGMSKVAWDNAGVFVLNAIGAVIGLGIGQFCNTILSGKHKIKKLIERRGISVRDCLMSQLQYTS